MNNKNNPEHDKMTAKKITKENANDFAQTPEGIELIKEVELKYEKEIPNDFGKIIKICSRNKNMTALAASNEISRRKMHKSISLLNEGCLPEEIAILENLPSENSKIAYFLDVKYNGQVWLEIDGRKIGHKIEDIFDEAAEIADKYSTPELHDIIKNARVKFEAYINKELAN